MHVLGHALIGYHKKLLKLLLYLFTKTMNLLIFTLGARPSPRFLYHFPVSFPSFPVGCMSWRRNYYMRALVFKILAIYCALLFCF